MQTANEIKSTADNMEYYASKIIELTNKQYDLDAENGQPSLAIISSINISGHWIRTYCQDIKRDLEGAK